VVEDARAELAACSGARNFTTLRERVTEILLELEWKEQCHAAQLREAEMAESEPLVVELAGAGGKRGRRRARQQSHGRGSSGATFGRPLDWKEATRHLYLANTGPKFGLSAEAMKEELNRCGRAPKAPG
jgi:hypothetical protein